MLCRPVFLILASYQWCHNLPLLRVVQRLNVAHEDDVLRGQPRHEEDRPARGGVHRAVPVRLEDAEGPVKVGLLLEVGADVGGVALADALSISEGKCWRRGLSKGWKLQLQCLPDNGSTDNGSICIMVPS